MKEQIEEIDELTTVLYEANHKRSVLDYLWLATEAYNAGYRKQEWISVEDRLPPKYRDVLIFCYGSIGKDFICSNGFWYDNIPKYVTHWMPLPEPPKKGGE